MNSHSSFDHLWEGYLFNVAATFIDSMSPSDQTKIVKFINQVGNSSTKNTSLGKQLPVSVVEKLTVSPLEQLESQWQIALKETLPSVGSLSEGQNALLSRSHVLTQQLMASTLASIKQMNSLIERAKNSNLDSFLQSRLLSHYQGIQNKFTAHLVKLKTLHDDRLSRFTR